MESAEVFAEAEGKWPGWPGDNVFRLVVPVAKVGSIIGRKGELVKKMCEETGARIRVLEGPQSTPDRIVLISGKEEPEAPLSPAMDAVLRVFKRVTGLLSGDGDDSGSGTVNAAAAASFCSIRLLVASSQAINLIGKQGSVIKSIQENTSVSVRVMPEDELPSYATSDERIVEMHGETLKVFNALEAVIGHLRKFLVDHSVIPLFEKSNNATMPQDRTADAQPDTTQSSFFSTPAHAPQIGIISDYSLSLKRDPSLYDPESYLDPKIAQSGLSLYRQDPSFGGLRPTGLGRTTPAIVTQITQTLQVPLSYAEDIIGIGGSNIAYIRRNSGAILTIQESRGLPEEITIEIKGTTAQVQMAQHLIQEFVGNQQEAAGASVYGKIDSGIGSYSQVPDVGYRPSSSSSFSSHTGGGRGYGASNMGGYGSPGGGLYSQVTDVGYHPSSSSSFSSHTGGGGGGGYGESNVGGYGSPRLGGYNGYRF